MRGGEVCRPSIVPLSVTSVSDTESDPSALQPSPQAQFWKRWALEVETL